MKLTKKQVAQATYPLHQDREGRFSYPELVEYIFGRKEWERVKQTFGLSGGNMDGKSTSGLADELRLELSPKLLLEIEHKYNDLLEAEDAISRGAGRLAEDEFLMAFKRCNIHVQAADQKALNTFFKINSKDMHNTISFDRLFESYRLTDRLPALLGTLQGHFSMDYETQVAANKALRAEKYSFEDVVYLLKRSKFEMSLIARQPPDARGGPPKTGPAGAPGPAGPRAVAGGLRPEEFPVVYKDLFDLFQALKGNEPEYVHRSQLVKEFKIPRVNIEKYSDEEDEAGEKDGMQAGKKQPEDGRQEARGRTPQE